MPLVDKGRSPFPSNRKTTAPISPLSTLASGLSALRRLRYSINLSTGKPMAAAFLMTLALSGAFLTVVFLAMMNVGRML
jgi:hypothetical protein